MAREARGAGQAPLRYPWNEAPEKGAWIEVTQGVLWLRLPLPMALDHVNVYALDDGADGWTVIDTGTNDAATRAIWTRFMDEALGGRPVHRVIATHHHPDHLGLAGWFQSAHGAEMAASRTAWLTARMLTLDTQEEVAPENSAFWRAAGMEPQVYASRMKERPWNFSDVVAPIPLGFTRLQEGQSIELGGRTWDIRMGNGHAPEHATLWSRDDGLVIGGDQLLPSISPNVGVYATEPEADPLAEWMEACERLAQHASEDQLVLPGHKLPFTGLPMRMSQLIDNHHGALARLVEVLAKPHTAVDCFPVLFKRKIGPAEYGLALAEAMAHLNHLLAEGRITRSRREDEAWIWQAV